jgi:hypothetical protein
MQGLASTALAPQFDATVDIEPDGIAFEGTNFDTQQMHAGYVTSNFS